MTKNLTAKITNAAIKKAVENKILQISDTQLSGFQIRVGSTGASFRYRYYSPVDSKRRVVTIGRFPKLSADEARKIAVRIAGQIAEGVDPQKLKQDRLQELKASEENTFSAYLNGAYSLLQKRKKTGADTVSMLNRHFASRWSNRPLNTLTRRDVMEWQNDCEQVKGLHHATISRAYGALKTMLNAAVKDQVIKLNPLDQVHIEPPAVETDSKVNRSYLSSDEIKKLYSGLDAYQLEKKEQRRSSRSHGKSHLPDISDLKYVDHVVPMILILLHTGMRPGDVFTLRWSHINFKQKQIRKVAAKTAHKVKNPMNIPINSELFDVLSVWRSQASAQEEDEFVFVNKATGREFRKEVLRKPWKRIKTLAKLPDNLDLYSLRHNFASQLIMTGADLLTVSKLMGHTKIQTTIEHYGHLAPDRASEYVEKLTSIFER